MVWRWVGVAALGLLAGCGAPDRAGPRRAAPGRAGSQSADASTCQERVQDWSARCEARRQIRFAATQCPEAGMVLLDLAGDPPLRVEMRRSNATAFRRAGAWGLSPVGDFADWSRVDPRMRERFERVTECVRDGADFDGTAVTALRSRGDGPRAPTALDSVPWLLLGALACVLAALWPVRRSVAWRRRALVAVALAAGTLALRALLLPEMFFHQNGQGPFWVAGLVAPQQHFYGPGYRAVFGWLRWLAREPDRAVFLAQGLLAGLAVPAAAFTARRLGATRPLAGALALAVAVDPILGRLSRSESYYGLGATLLFLATALLAAASTQRVRSAGFRLLVLAAALVVAQHALVHPVGWVAAALCPAAFALGPGRRRLLRTALAVAVVAAVVAVFAGPSMVASLRSSLGDQWAGGDGRAVALSRLRVAGAWLSYGLPLALVGVALARRKGRAALVVVLGAVTMVGLYFADIASSARVIEPVHQAYLRLYAPVGVALLAAASAALSRARAFSRVLAAAVVLLALFTSWRRWPAWTSVPTDAREEAALMRWRRDLPTGRILYLERAERRIQTLPFYRGGRVAGPSPIGLRAGEFAEDFPGGEGARFYVRTSLCSTREGRAFCERIERRYRMTLLREVTLPAVPSMPYLAYDSPRVGVALYRVTGRVADVP